MVMEYKENLMGILIILNGKMGNLKAMDFKREEMAVNIAVSSEIVIDG